MQTGILLINLGTPDSPDVPEVRRYLREFLSDPRVIDIPGWARRLLLHLFILPFRPKQSAKAYRKIWQQNGSPLLIHSQQLSETVSKQLGNNYYVELGMRYGNPSIESALKNLKSKHCDKLIILPLFPQYSSAASGSAIQKTLELINQEWNIPEIEIRNDFFNHPLFINAYADVIKNTLSENKPDLLLFSYHGLPERHIDKSGCDKNKTCDRHDQCPAISSNNRYCYRGQCLATSHLIAKQLGLSKDQYITSFQSRLGRTPWIKPYTDLLLPKLAKRGIKKIAVVCPSFVADCLETLEEMGIRAREQWMKLGGENFTLIPCVNTHSIWVQALLQIIKE